MNPGLTNQETGPYGMDSIHYRTRMISLHPDHITRFVAWATTRKGFRSVEHGPKALFMLESEDGEQRLSMANWKNIGTGVIPPFRGVVGDKRRTRKDLNRPMPRMVRQFYIQMISDLVDFDDSGLTPAGEHGTVPA